MFKKSLGKNSAGVERIFHYDPDTEETHIEYQQDVTASLEYSKRMAKEPDYWKEGVKKSFAHVAHIPLIVQYRWLEQYGRDDDPMKPENFGLLCKLLESPEFRYLKTTDKKIVIAR